MMATRYPKKNYEYVTGRDRRKDKMMRKKELIEILEQHKLWLSYDEEGTRADLSGANLSRADLSCANLRYANLSGADLSGAKGILDAAEWMKENFVSTSEGVIVYKAFGDTIYAAPERWEVAEGKYITEVCNPNRTDDCGCGVNFGTLEWIHSNIDNPTPIWKCLIEWIDLVSVVVPYNTDGKARCERLKLIERIE